MGAHGLPLIGTGDWNDGLDEIGSQGRGESVWLGFFLVLHPRAHGRASSPGRKAATGKRYYRTRLRGASRTALEGTWRGDRYLRAIHDDGTEIGVKGSGVWEIDALTAAWAVMSGINPERGRIVFETALQILEKENDDPAGLAAAPRGHQALSRPEQRLSRGRPRERDVLPRRPMAGRRGAAPGRAAPSARAGPTRPAAIVETAYRLWLKISPLPHAAPGEIETYGGQPNKQAADMVTTFDPGRMIWNGYTGAAGWMFRQALEGVLGLRLVGRQARSPRPTHRGRRLEPDPVVRDTTTARSGARSDHARPAQQIAAEQATTESGLDDERHPARRLQDDIDQ